MAGTNPGSMCTDTTNLLFVQYSCEQNKEEQSAKFNHLIVASATASLISLLFVLNLSSLYKGGKIQQLEWDISTVTAGDYSVEFDIPRRNYEEWYNRTYLRSGGEKDQGYSPALSLKRHMIETIEQALNEEVAQRKNEGGHLSGRKST